jgi:two-component system response regulator WspF
MKIAIVNHVVMAIEAMRRVVLGSGLHQIAWTAANGNAAVDQCLLDTPELILMDVIMPGSDGVEAVRQIMARCPCPILVVTANVMGNCSQVFEAMGAGALDAVNTPVLEWPASRKGAAELLAKIETIRRLIGLESLPKNQKRHPPIPHHPERNHGPLIAIGASAGGPAALAHLLSYFPAAFRSPVVVVQHVDPQFAPPLANWLDHHTPLRVRIAQEHDLPTPGTILLGGRDRHLVLSAHGRLAYCERPIDSSYRPSVDVFFQSISRHWRGEVVGVLLTGMGRDGAQGLLTLRRNGHLTIAQDQLSSAVYGMPKAAADLHAATQILNLSQIGLRLRALGTQRIHVHA